jgi:hypothetical protein
MNRVSMRRIAAFLFPGAAVRGRWETDILKDCKMKKIWIRSEISSAMRIIMSASFILIVLVAWLIVTTVRAPRETIPGGDFERLTAASKITQTDRQLLLAAYSFDASKGLYKIRKGLDNREKIMICEILVTLGYSGRDPLPNPIFSPNVLPSPIDILASFPHLAMGTSELD